MRSLLHDFYHSKPLIETHDFTHASFLKIKAFNNMYDESESIGQQLLQSFSNSGAKLVYYLYYDGHEVHVHVGVLPTPSSETSRVLHSQLKAAIHSEVVGINLEEISAEEIVQIARHLRKTSVLMGIPKSINTTLDRLVLAMGKSPFSFSVVAQNITHTQYISMRDDLFGHRSLLSTQKSTQEQTSRIEMKNHTQSSNQNVVVASKGNTSTSGTSEQKSLTITKEDSKKEFEYQLLKEVLLYIEKGMQTGLWHSNVFLSTENDMDLRKLEAIMKGLFMRNDKEIPEIYSGLGTFQHDYFHTCKNHFVNPLRVQESKSFKEFFKYDCAVILSSELLANSFLFSYRTIPGLDVYHREPLEIKYISEGVKLGKYRNVINDTPYDLKIPSRNLNRHVFITGLTGSGKTNTVQNLLLQSSTKFLIIEPAKSEYRRLQQVSDLDVKLFTVGDVEQPFSINPFALLPGMNLQKHIDILKSVINSAFGMYGPLPYIIEKALTNTYKEKGWNLITSQNEKGLARDELFPTMEDFKDNVVKLVEQSGYAPEQKMNIESALIVRLESLCEGIKGTIFNTRESLDVATLLKDNVIIELRHLGDEEDQSFIIGMILSLIYEYLELNGQSGEKLKHIIVIEEAHRILPNINTETKSADFGTMRNKSVSFFNNMLSEIRAYGEGIIVVDQIPSKVSSDILKNTNVKIVHRLVAEDDKKQIASMINLKEEQCNVMTELETGEALVYFEGLNTPAYAKMDHVKDQIKSPMDKQINNPVKRYVNIQIEESQENFVLTSCNQLFYHMVFDYPIQVSIALQKTKQMLAMKYPNQDIESILYKGISKVVERKYYLLDQVKLYGTFKSCLRRMVETSDNNKIQEIQRELTQVYERKNAQRMVDSTHYYDEALFLIAVLSEEMTNQWIEQSFTSQNSQQNMERLYQLCRSYIESQFITTPSKKVAHDFTMEFLQLLMKKLDPKAQKYLIEQLRTLNKVR